MADNRRLATRALEEGEFDAVVAAGGDGTILGAASALLGSRLPLGIIPIGTGNVLAHEIGLALDATAVANCLTGGRIAEVPMSCANGQPFLLMAGAGFDGRVIAHLDWRLRRRLGKLAYVWPVVRALASGPDQLRIRVDGAEHSASWAVATAVRHYAGAFVLAPEARLEEPALHVVLFKSQGRISMIGQLIIAALGLAGWRRDIVLASVRDVEIEADRPVPVQIDGEPFGSTPVSISAGGQSLHLIVPSDSPVGGGAPR